VRACVYVCARVCVCVCVYASVWVHTNIFLLLRHNHGTASRKLQRIETYTNGVWCEALTVENINGKNT
jgi:hypothetical protein